MKLARRRFLSVTAGAAGIPLMALSARAQNITAGTTSAQDLNPALGTRHLFSMTLKVTEIQNLGKTPQGDRRVALADGGTFEGPRLKGTVLRGGSDWLIIRPDGALQIDVRLTLKADDDAIIGMTYRGVRHGPPAVIERLNRGDNVDPSEYYFRMAAFFETASEKYGWLNRILTIATGHRPPGGPLYQVYEVL